MTMSDRPSCPEPLWVGFRLRVAQCECGEKFKGRNGQARAGYEAHWRDVHELDAYGTRPAYERVEGWERAGDWQDPGRGKRRDE